MRKTSSLRPWLVALALCCAAGCSEQTTDVDPDPSTEALAMRFGTAAIGSRALLTNADLQKSGAAFRVWGIYHATNDAALRPTTVFDGTAVTNDGAGNWSYDDTQYWFPGFTYHFRALFPADAAATARLADAGSGGDTYLTLDGFDVATQTDLLAAAAGPFVCRQGTPMGKVNIDFGHQLAQVTFRGAADPALGATAVTVRRIELTAVRTADWSGAGSPSAKGGRWTPRTNGTFVDDTQRVLPADGSAVDMLTDARLMIPQRLDDCRLEIAYRYAGDTADRTASVSLAAASSALPDGWEAGRRYNYVFTLGPADYVLFAAPTVEPWQESTGGSIRID